MKISANFTIMFVVLTAAAMLACSSVYADSSGQKSAGDTANQDERTENVGLLEYSSIQNALELNDSQKKEIADVNKMLDDSVPNPETIRNLPERQREVELHAWEMKAKQLKDKLGDVLDENQLKRLKEIALQLRLKIRAGTLLAEKKISDQLSLSDKQKEDLLQIHDQIQTEIAEARDKLIQSGAQAGKLSEEKVEQFRGNFQKMREKAYEKAMNILTPEQKEKLSKLTGKLSDINIEDILAEQSARVEKWTSRWRKQSESAADKKSSADSMQTSPQHPVGTATEDTQSQQ